MKSLTKKLTADLINTLTLARGNALILRANMFALRKMEDMIVYELQAKHLQKLIRELEDD